MAPSPAAVLVAPIEGDHSIGIVVRYRPGAVHVLIEGELDEVSLPCVEAALGSLIASGHPTVVIDLAATSYLGAGAVRVLIAAERRALAAGGSIAVRSPSPVARRVFEVTAMTHLLEPTETPSVRSTAGAVVEAAPLPPSPRALAHPPTTSGADAALTLVALLAQAAIVGAGGASVTVDRSGQMTTVGASDATVEQMDRDQYATGEGPCLAAAQAGQVFYVESVDRDLRWPRFMARARGRGIASILSSPLVIEAEPVGALNIYSTVDGGFGPSERQVAALLADHASAVLAEWSPTSPGDEVARRLQGGLRAREVIAQAQGALMARDQTTPERAYAHLRRTSRTSGLTVLERAIEILASGDRSTADEGSS